MRDAAAGRGRLAVAEPVDAGARRVRDGELVDEILLAVEERVKRQAVQDVVRHDDEVRRLQPIADGRNERSVELAKMRLGRGLELIGERADVGGLQAELGQLELQERDPFANLGSIPQRDDVEPIAPDDAHVVAPAGLVVLEEDRVGLQDRSNLVEAFGRAALQGRELFVGPPKLVERSAQLFLERRGPEAEALHSPERALFGPDFLQSPSVDSAS